MQLTLTNATYSYEDAPDRALTPVTATFTEGWTGVVGPNGTGKTTLLRLMCGEFAPTSGSITPLVKGVYCAQETERRPLEAEDFALDFSNEAMRIRRILNIDDDWIWRYDTLSEGERKRLQVAVALWQNPAVLALDEPTNHVDAPCRARLIEALSHYRGVGLLVSHDREMLDALTSQCLFLSSSTATMRPGNYSHGKEQEELEHATAVHERKTAKAELSRLQKVKVARDVEASRADARRSKRNIPKGDKDAKARIDLAIYTGQDGKAGKRSVQMDAHVAAAEKRLQEARVEKTYNSDVWLDAEPSKRRVLVELEKGLIRFGATSDSRGVTIPDLAVGPTDHIAVVGPNGAGKSTLIAELIRALPEDINCAYLPQELSSAQRQEQLQTLKKLPHAEQGRVLSIVALLNSDPGRLLSGEQASPGETRKLMLALDILSKPQIIIMDEPTNHLDITSTEALERMLAACPCALILVSHDQQFLEAATTMSWVITPGKEGSQLTVV